MATKKTAPKKATKPAAKAASKAPAKPVKPVAAKTVTKVAPAKKVVPAKAASPKKAVAPAKKVVVASPKKPVTKPVAKVESKKVVATKPKVTKSEPTKKTVAPKKETVVKPSAKKVVAAPVVEKPIIVEKAKPAVKTKPVATTPTKPTKKALEPIKEVKVPKISTKTSVPYNPIYTPMEKRSDIQKPGAPLVKYSDADLNEFRDLINKKLDTAKKELAYLQGLITRKDEMGGSNDDARYMTMEDGSMSMEREQLSQMASRQITYIDHLEKAIMRIENKTYGVCRVTGKLIDKARLRAVPHATLSLEAKLGLVKPSAEQ